MNAPYLLCAGRIGDAKFGRRCRRGASVIREEFAVCADCAAIKYALIVGDLRDQLSRILEEP